MNLTAKRLSESPKKNSTLLSTFLKERNEK